jgi:flagellar hook protein FlgE
MLRSMFSSISGLRAHQTMMDVTGNNIANVNTTGYKSSQALFQDTLSQLLQAAGAPDPQVGGTNPAQVGLGTRIAGIATTFTQGAAQTTGRSTDLMISGDGFFVINKSGQQLYTRAGAFSFDARGSLVTQDGAFVQGWMAVNGAVDTTQPIQDLRLPVGTLLPPVASTTADVTGNLPADAATGTVLTTTIPTFDDLGNELTLTAQFTKTANPSEWSLVLTRQGTPPAAPLLVTIPAPPAPVVPAAAPPIGGVTVSLAGLTGFAGTSSAALTTQNGSAVGTLQAFTLGNDGSMVGVFSNGLRQTLGRVALAAFNNPQGLEKVGNTAYRDSVNSGLPQVGTPGSGSRGTLQGASLEMSNVDLSQEFTNLIISQRGFQANSRVITASDELLQDLVNMKR